MCTNPYSNRLVLVLSDLTLALALGQRATLHNEVCDFGCGCGCDASSSSLWWLWLWSLLSWQAQATTGLRPGVDLGTVGQFDGR